MPQDGSLKRENSSTWQDTHVGSEAHHLVTLIDTSLTKAFAKEKLSWPFVSGTIKYDMIQDPPQAVRNSNHLVEEIVFLSN